MENQDPLSFYDLIINVNAMKSLLGNGWEEEFSTDGLPIYEEKKDKPSVVVSVVGNQNKGKSFILGKISGQPIPDGYTCITKGLSIKYPTIEKQNIILLDTAGFESPLVENDDYKLTKDKKEFILDEESEIKEIKCTEIDWKSDDKNPTNDGAKSEYGIGDENERNGDENE